MIFEVKWSPEIMNYYKHGSIVEYFFGNQVVFFHNNMLSPGATIVKWESNSTYQGNRTFVQLPLLAKGKKYQVTLQARANLKTPLIKIIFYDRVGCVLSIKVVKEGRGEFVYPITAYSYSIELLNNGVKELFFQSILITSESESKEIENKVTHYSRRLKYQNQKKK